jgi:methionyl-tRNA formyltransferase
MELEEGLDTGPVYRRAVVAIDDDETADELRARLVGIGVPLLLDALASGLGEPEPQTGEATYAAKVDPTELEIDWTRPGNEVARVVRLGRAWTRFRGKRLRVLRARTTATTAEPGELDGVVVGAGDGTGLELLEVQPEGKGPQAASAWRNGARPEPHERLGQ